MQQADEILAELNTPGSPQTAVEASDLGASRSCGEKAEKRLRHLRKLEDARNTADALIALNPAVPGSPEELLLVMSTAGDSSDAILARLAKITAGHETDPRMMLLTARTYAAVHDLSKSREAALAVASLPLPTDIMVLQLSDLLDRLEEFPTATLVIDRGLAQFHSETLQDEHFRRMVFREQYEQADKELSSLDTIKRPLLTGLHVIALCEWAAHLEESGDTPAAAILRSKASTQLAALDECAKHWDTRASGWHDVLQLAYFEKNPSQRELIDKSRDALARDPANPFFYYTLGNTYREADDDSAAIIQWRSAAALAPSWAKPLARAARYFISNGDPLQALDLAQKADRRLPNQKETLVSIAIAWQKSLGAPNVPDAAALLAFITDPAHQATFGWNENILPMEVWLKAQTNQRPAAEARVIDAIAHIPAQNAATLLQLSIASQQSHLTADLPARCLNAYRKLQGDDADLATAQARLILDAAGTPNTPAYTEAAAKAKSLFSAARDAHSADNPTNKGPAWGLAWCRLLEQLHDPAAPAAWKDLSAKNLASNDAQWSALAASSLHADHAVRGDILDRLQKLDGDTGLSWRLQKGLWLLEDPARSGNLDAALTLLKQTAAMSPDSAPARHLLGQALASAGRIPESLTELSRAAELDPRNMQTKNLLGRLYLLQGDKVRAVEQLRRVTESPIASADERTKAAVLLTNAGHVDAAMPVLLANEANDPAIKELVAGHLWQTGDWQGAAARYTDLLKNPTPEIVEQSLHFFASLNEAWATTDSEKLQITQAREVGQKQALAALDTLQAPDALKHAIRGSFEVQNDHLDAAVAELTTAVKLDPASAPFHRRLITTLLSAAKVPDAIAAAQDAAKSLPDDPGCRALLVLGSGDTTKSPLNDLAVREYLIAGLLTPSANQDMPQAATLLASAGSATPRAISPRNSASSPIATVRRSRCRCSPFGNSWPLAP